MNNNNKVVLSVSDLSVFYNQQCILNKICFDVMQGSCVGIVGPNGAGKSTLLKAIMGIIPKKSGNVTVFNERLLNGHKKIAYVSQRSSIDWDFPVTVFDVALMGSYAHLGWFKRPSEKEKRSAWQALDRVGMAHCAERPIGLLSGGQQQRVFLARALVQDADFYIMDEPFAGVDMATERIIIELFKELCQRGKTIIVVHHDLQTLQNYFDTLLVVNRSLISYGDVHTVLQSDALDLAYGKYVQCNNKKNYSHSDDV